VQSQCASSSASSLRVHLAPFLKVCRSRKSHPLGIRDEENQASSDAMLAILHLFATFVANLFKSRRRLEVEKRRVLTSYSLYYNETRTHLGLGKDAPLRRAVQRSGTIIITPILSGLHHRYARI
jgi:hypothetical protein